MDFGGRGGVEIRLLPRVKLHGLCAYLVPDVCVCVCVFVFYDIKPLLLHPVHPDSVLDPFFLLLGLCLIVVYLISGEIDQSSVVTALHGTRTVSCAVVVSALIVYYY